MKTSILSSTIAIALLLAACGREETAAPAAEPAPVVETAPASTPAPAVETAPVAAANAPLAASDIDAYVTGLQREIELLRGHADALAKAREAKDSTAEMTATMALNGVEIRDAGAAAAGVDVARYATIKETIDDVLSAIEMGAAMKPQLDAAEQADLSAFTAEQRAQHDANLAQLRAAFAAPYDRLPADLIDTFKARETELAALRAEALKLKLSPLQG